MKDQIIDYIRRNRVSSTEVADCLKKTGEFAGVHALNRGHFCVGSVHWVYAYGESNWPIHEQIENVQAGDIVVVENLGCGDRAMFGDLVTKFLMLYRQARGIVVRGKLRDVPHLIKENWPIWYTGPTPIGCFNRDVGPYGNPAEVEELRERFHGAIAVCDDSGVIIIEKEFHNQDFLKELDFIEEQEDIWFDCVDRKKWTTYETVCLRKYEQK